MNFSKTKIGASIIIIIIYTYLWWHLNDTFLGTSNPYVLLDMNRDGLQGYNSIIAYCTYYCVMFLTFVNVWIPKENVVFLTRMKSRLIFVRKRNIQILVCSAVFTAVIIGVNILMTSVVFNIGYLVDRHFYTASMATYIGLTVFYWWIGLLFQLFIELLKKNTIAMVITILIISTIYFIGARYGLLWTPLKDMNIYGRFLSTGNMVEVLMIYLKQIIMVIAGYWSFKTIFLEKDIYENEK